MAGDALTVVFFKGRRYWRTWFLAWWQRSEYSHCAIALRRIGDVHELASSTLAHGVSSIPTRLKTDDWDAYSVPADHDAAVFWLAAHLGQSYGLFGMLGFMFRRIKGPADQWWCSKAVAAMLGFQDPWRYDVATLHDVCRRIGCRVSL